MRDNGIVRGSSHWTTRALIGAALFLAFAANLGLKVHSGHHPVVVVQSGAAVLSIAGHGEPDRTLHLDDLAETRYLICPVCLAQYQVDGGHLLDLRVLDRPAVARLEAERLVGAAVSPSATGMSPRAPPFC
jgi:hypothetical protein